MKRYLLDGLWLALLGAAGAALVAPVHANQPPQLQVWRGAPAAKPIVLKDLDGRPFSLADLRGKVVLVNFWATWCEPCVEEMPSLQRLRERLRGEPFEIVGVNYQEGEARIRAFLQKVPVQFPLVRDTDGAVARSWQARVFPGSFLIDGGGNIRYTLVGAADWSDAAIEARVRALLPRAPAARRD